MKKDNWKVGDLVTIKKYNLKKDKNGDYVSKTNEEFLWLEEMDQYEGRTLKVIRVQKHGVHCDKKSDCLFVWDWTRKPTSKEKARYLAEQI